MMDVNEAVVCTARAARAGDKAVLLADESSLDVEVQNSNFGAKVNKQDRSLFIEQADTRWTRGEPHLSPAALAEGCVQLN